MLRRFAMGENRWLEGATLVVFLAIFVALGLAYSAVIPAYEGPDEDAHFRYIAHLARTHRLPELNAESVAISHQLVQQPPLYYVLAALVVAPTSIDQTLAWEVTNPYLEKGLSRRSHLVLPDAPPAGKWPLALGRGVSLVGGLLAVLGTWLLTRTLFPGQLLVAYAAAALVGLNPQFLWSAATITNDSWAAAGIVWPVWWALRSDPSRHPRRWLGVGILVGLAALLKYSDLVALLLVGSIWLYHMRRTPLPARRTGLVALLWMTAGGVAVAGFWYWHTLRQLGEIVPMASMAALQPGMARPRLLGWDDPLLAAQVRWLVRSYWGVFGYGIVAPAWYHGVVQNLLLVATGGLILLPLRARRDVRYRTWLPLALSLLWLGAVFGGLLNWMRAMQFTDQGRLLFPAAPAVALLILLGWRAWLPWRALPWLAGAAVLLMSGLAVSQLWTLYAAYALPDPLPAPLVYDRPIQVGFDGGMQLLGLDLDAGAVLEPGVPLPLTLYFTTDVPIAENYTLFLHLADGQNQLIYQMDGVPAQGRHPTRQWQPNQVFADAYQIQVAEIAQAGLATLSVGFYRYDTPTQRQAARVLHSGAALGDRVVLAQVRLLTAPSTPLPPAASAVARWKNGIELASSDAALDELGQPSILTLQWRAGATLHQDYTVFVQVLDAKQQIVAQVDRQPQAGQAPTSTWRAGDGVGETIVLPPPRGPWARVILGLYDGQGERLRLASEDSADFVTLLLQPIP